CGFDGHADVFVGAWHGPTASGIVDGQSFGACPRVSPSRLIYGRSRRVARVLSHVFREIGAEPIRHTISRWRLVSLFDRLHAFVPLHRGPRFRAGFSTY